MDPKPVFDYERLLIVEFEYWKLYLNPNQVYLGRCYLALKRDGDLDPYTDTTQEERDEHQLIMEQLKVAFGNLFQPLRLNYDNLRNVWLHCHWHIVPRYDTEREFAGLTFTDPSGGTKNWSPYDKEHETPLEVLLQIRDAIREELAKA